MGNKGNKANAVKHSFKADSRRVICFVLAALMALSVITAAVVYTVG